VVISPLVVTEVDRLAKARFGSQARTAIIDFVLDQAGQSRFQIPETGLEVLGTARMVQRQYARLDLGPGRREGHMAWPSTQAYRGAVRRPDGGLD
jgi:hypothetical protein